MHSDPELKGLLEKILRLHVVGACVKVLFEWRVIGGWGRRRRRRATCEGTNGKGAQGTILVWIKVLQCKDSVFPVLLCVVT